MKRRVLFGILVATMVAVPLVDGCRAPTQVTVDIRTRASCNDLRGVDIIVGEDPLEVQSRVSPRVPTTSTNQCAGDSIGTLVLTPSGDTGSIAIIAGFGGRPVSECSPSDNFASCIVARRRFAFIDHVNIALPIVLDPDCVGIPCGATETCIGKKCVDSEVTCEASGTCTAPGTLPDGTPKPIDGSANDGTLADGRPLDDAPFDVLGVDVDGGALDSTTDGQVEPGPSSCGTKLYCPLSGPPPARMECMPNQPICCFATGQGQCAQSCPGYPTACCAGTDQCLNGQHCCVLGGGPTFTGQTIIRCGAPLECSMAGTNQKVCRTPSPGPSSECPTGMKCGPSPFGPFYLCQ